MLRDDLTIIYYTSNREKVSFESKIQADLFQKAQGIPIICVSQKPVRFGHNICVGDVGLSDYNIYRQMQIGCLEAKTKYVCTAEADCLYPSTGYFDFKPPDENIAYHYMNLYILWKNSHIFRPKAFSLCGLFSNREFLLTRFERSLNPKVKWAPGYKPHHPLFYKYHDWTPFRGDVPIINTKTGDGMRIITGTETMDKAVKELPVWGKAVDMEKFLWPDLYEK
jgi:hypothetical protein